MRTLRLLLSILNFILIANFSMAQTLPANRAVDWSLAGLRDTSTTGFTHIDMSTMGIHPNGTIANDSILASVLAVAYSPGVILHFPAGDFLFNDPIVLSSNTVIKGAGAEHTTFMMDQGGQGASILISGSLSNDTSSLIQAGAKDSNSILIRNTTAFSLGSWGVILQDDNHLIDDAWAFHTVGQVIQIIDTAGHKTSFNSPLRMGFPLQYSPYIQRINPIINCGVECLKLHRIDHAINPQVSNIDFRNAFNCWVRNIESENCDYSHISIRQSSNIHISCSYFHHAFDYGGGGQGYGIMIHATSGECLVENNIFQHLRHAMIIQAGGNGNVFAYNYSREPIRTEIPTDAGGDMTMHGNYAHSNLFEQNYGQNISVDDSHGANGPYNTFFRNRAELYGVMIYASSPLQNIIGNDIPNTSFPYSLANYSILSSNNFLYGNNNKGNIDPAGTSVLQDQSYYYSQCPAFLTPSQYAGIGTPNTMGSKSIPAKDRFDSGNYFDPYCSPLTSIDEIEEVFSLLVYPNPATDILHIDCDKAVSQIQIMNVCGKIVYETSSLENNNNIITRNWANGIYLIKFLIPEGQPLFRKIIISN